MASSTKPPQAALSLISRADGSATYSHNGYTVTAAINGPVEASRRDELPSEAAIDVTLRSAVGVGSPRERHIETIIHDTLRSIILTKQFPRTLIQVTLQVVSLPEVVGTGASKAEMSMSSSVLPLLPALLQASMLALLSASIPLSTTFTATLVAIDLKGELIHSPSSALVAIAQSLHVFAFSSRRELLLSESEGEFEYEEWGKASRAAEEECCAESSQQSGEGMDIDSNQRLSNMGSWLQAGMEGAIKEQLQWKVITKANG